MNKRIAKFILLFFVLLTGCNADLYTKLLAKNSLKESATVTIVDGYIELSYTENEGMVFGLLNNKESHLKHYLLVGLNCISALVLIFIIWRFRKFSFYYHLPFFIILAGAFGNLIDRIINGRVVDFIHIHLKDFIDWPFLFNLADVLISLGGILLVILLIFKWDTLEKEIFHQIGTTSKGDLE